MPQPASNGGFRPVMGMTRPKRIDRKIFCGSGEKHGGGVELSMSSLKLASKDDLLATIHILLVARTDNAKIWGLSARLCCPASAAEAC